MAMLLDNSECCIVGSVWLKLDFGDGKKGVCA